jgi:diguanylate cyclase (GGDEF)-like protein/putative nucleotidyltransferase with HDIG domain
VPTSLEKILASDRLPSLSEVAMKVVEITKRPEPDYADLVEAIRLDPAIAGRVLKTANSALMGMRNRATSIESAVPRLGTTMVRALVLGFTLADYQNRKSIVLRPWYQKIWRESLIQAAAAEALAERQRERVDPGTWFLAGLLQDIGRLAILSTCHEEYVDNVLEVEDGRNPLEIEQKYFGFTHVDVGVALCRRWNLDEEIIQAISIHHSAAHRVVPLRFVSSASLSVGLITAAHFAEYLEEVGHNPGCIRENIERLLMQVFALRPQDIFRLLADVDQRVGEIAAAFSVDIGSGGSLESVLADAQEQLAQIAINGQLRLVTAAATSGRQETSRGESCCDSGVPGDRLWQDPLTNAYNLKYLDQALAVTVQHAHQKRVPMGLLLIDIDGFSALNANSGRQFGDETLKQTVEILRDCVRMSDSVIRFGGDEFLIVMSDINIDMLAMLAEQICHRITRDLRPEPDPGTPQSCSIGAVFYAPSATRPATAQSLIQEAEKACREAQRQGGRQEVTFSVEDRGSVRVDITRPNITVRHIAELSGAAVTSA